MTAVKLATPQIHNSVYYGSARKSYLRMLDLIQNQAQQCDHSSLHNLLVVCIYDSMYVTFWSYCFLIPPPPSETCTGQFADIGRSQIRHRLSVAYDVFDWWPCSSVRPPGSLVFILGRKGFLSDLYCSSIQTKTKKHHCNVKHPW